MNGPIGVVGGPQPGGPNPHPNKPGGVVPNTVGVPGVAAPAGVPPMHVSVAPGGAGAASGAGPVGVSPANSVPSNLVNPAPPAMYHHQMVGPFQGSGQLGVVHQSHGHSPSRRQGYVSDHLQGAWAERKKLWKDVGQVVVSSVLSIHNRSKLFKRALYGYLWQTMPAESWEIILIDDLSTEDLSETYKPLLGRINLRHVKFDHTKHPIFQKKNPNWTPGQKKNWYHTPALTINLGMHLARGPIISLCHPEILHAPENFELASVRILNQEAYLFGTTYLGTQDSNLWLDKNPSWVNFGWQGFLSRVAAQNLPQYKDECYWYTSFLPRKVARTIGGVDFSYLDGVAGEDDDFRDRVRRAGWDPVWAPELEGFHQNHDNETESHRIRTTEAWRKGLEHNRNLYRQRQKSGWYPAPANSNCDWTSRECFVEEVRYTVGSREPEIIKEVQ